MKKRVIIISVAIIFCIAVISGSIFLMKKTKTFKPEVTLVTDLRIPYGKKVYLHELIKDSNGIIPKDQIVNTNEIGEFTYNFTFKNEDNKTAKYSFDYEVYDDVPPVIWLNGSYSIAVNSDSNFKDKILCGDNETANPNCQIIGDYDITKVGNYQLTFKATDNSNNQTEIPFTLKVYQPTKASSSNNYQADKTEFNDIVKNYKVPDTKIGIDVSKWQGDIDFNALKNAGVEFVIIRVGGNLGTDEDFFLDGKFIDNIKGANAANIDVGLYFFSYSNTSALAIKDAKWVIEQIKDYDINLPIAFDWEDWNHFNNYNMSFNDLTQMGTAFINTLEDAGYEGMIYGSKSYLEKIWLPFDHDVWLAHYTNKTNYQKDYLFWQICNNGHVAGINGDVDIDIMKVKR